MKFLLACDSFKDCLSAKEVVDALSLGIQDSGRTQDTIVKIPLADGGEGSLDTIRKYKLCREIRCAVMDPLLREIEAMYLLEEESKIAYIEMAKASGLELLSIEERKAWNTSSYGTGQLIMDAIVKGAKKIFLFIGGSATNDLGIPMASACGYQFITAHGEVISYPRGKDLTRIQYMIAPRLNILEKVSFFTICDVKNTLTGINGASAVYGPQKGLSGKEIEILDKEMDRIADLINRQRNISLKNIPGSGAAGGIGGGSVAFLNSQLLSGGKFMLQLTDMEAQIRDADIVITGEGRMDIQTFNGKLIAHIADQAKQMHKDLIVVCGKVELADKDLQKFHIREAISLADLNNNPDYTSESTRELLFSVGKYIYNKYLGQ